jgi:Putative adhesin
MGNIPITCAILLLVLCPTTSAQDSSGQRVTVPFSNPARSRQVKVNVINGGIQVKGYSGNEVIVDAQAEEGTPSSEPSPRKAAGMKHLGNASARFTVEEAENVITVSVRPSHDTVNLVLQVPTATSLKLHSVDGEVRVEQVTGELEIQCVDGNVKLSDVSGSVVAHSVDGNITANLVKVALDKPMSFTTVDGDLDVTFPPDLKANVRIKSDDGEIYTDFDIQLRPDAGKPEVADSRSKNGKYRVKVDKEINGLINGGGSQILFKSVDGDIYIRKAGK